MWWQRVRQDSVTKQQLYQPWSKQRVNRPKLHHMSDVGAAHLTYIHCFPFLIGFQPNDMTVKLLGNPHHLSVSLLTSQNPGTIHQSTNCFLH